MRTVVHTLGYNTPRMIREATASLYALNNMDNIEHVITDLGYPLSDKFWDILPSAKDAYINKVMNIQENAITAADHGSVLLRIPNVGVSQNWTVVSALMQLKDGDCLICADPDERPQTQGWAEALAKVLHADQTIAWASLFMEEQQVLIDNGSQKFEEKIVDGIRVWYMQTGMNWAQGGFNAKFINQCGGVPYHRAATIYGWIEDACYAPMQKYGYSYVVLPDYKVEHIASSPIAMQWKEYITSNVSDFKGQLTFDEYIKMKSETAL